MQEESMDGLTDRQLKLSYWYISHKLSLKRLWTIFLIILSIALWSYVILQMTLFFMNYSAHKQLENYLLFTADPSLSRIESLMPKNISVPSVQVFGTGNGYDYLATISNGNKNWLGEFEYRFTNGTNTPQYKKGFVLPGSEANIMDFSRENDSPNFQINNFKWKRIEGYESLKNKMDYFLVENDRFDIGRGDKEPSTLSFEITNNSPYSYWLVDVQVIVYSEGTVAGINHYTLNQFKSGEKKQISLLWNHGLPTGLTYVILSAVNFLDPDNIMSVGTQ
ncbi:MAG: hypothetical protein WCV92_02220 [Candidatus Buchananbacteria bacterium]